MKLAAIVVSIVIGFAVIACAGNGDEPPTIVAPSPEPTVAETTPTSVPEPTATSAPEATATPEPTQVPEPTVNAGSTDPFPMTSNPDPIIGVYTLTDVRVGAHPESGGTDRIVFEFEDVEGFPGAHPGGMIEYVQEAFQCGSGDPVEVEGDVMLHVRFEATHAHDDEGQMTIDAIEIEGPGNSILEARSTCDFEAVVEWIIGVPAEQNFTVVFLEEPSRVVIDISWP